MKFDTHDNRCSENDKAMIAFKYSDGSRGRLDDSSSVESRNSDISLSWVQDPELGDGEVKRLVQQEELFFNV